jgi:hypothetical protein
MGPNPFVGDPLVAEHHRTTAVTGQVVVSTGLNLTIVNVLKKI